MITLTQLIQTAPFPGEEKKELLEKVDTFSPEKKFELEEMCWAFISTEYQNNLRYEMQKAVLENFSKEPSTPFNPQTIENNLFSELLKRLGATETEQDIEKVRIKLDEITKSNQVTT